MAKVITVTNVKGGVGKSTTSLFISNILKEQGKVLLIDIDSQNSLTSYFFEDAELINGKTILEAMIGEIGIQETINPIDKNLDFIPADITLSSLDKQLKNSRDFKLKLLLDEVKDNYDFIVIDTPPSLHLETIQFDDFFILPTNRERNRTIQNVIFHELKEKYADKLLDGVYRKADVQKLSYLGKSVNLKGLQTYKEYEASISYVLSKNLVRV